MSELVPTHRIADIVGVARHGELHYGRAVSAQQTVFILHSRDCIDSGIDLRACPFSIAMDRGIPMRAWAGMHDVATPLAIRNGELVPMPEAVL